MNLDISYENYKKHLDIHGTVLYPAVMVAPVQKEVLTWLMDGRENLKIFDPFHGSGTALYEASDIDSSVSILGYDINPLASLITLVKLQGIDETSFDDDYNLLEAILKQDFQFPVMSFYKSDKWFKPDMMKTLSKVSYAIREIENKQNRQYFWVMFCDIIRRYSNTRSSTYKLHIKEQAKIDSFKNNIIRDFLAKVKNSEVYYHNHFKNFNLRKGDSLQLIKEVQDNSIDILVTSPPYGENATTVPYGQFSYLQLSFIDKKDLEFEGWELNSCQTLDTSSMGGAFAKSELNLEAQILIQTYLNRITKDKHRKVIRFFSDYFEFLDQAARVSNQYIVLTLGNRTVNRVKINLARVTEKYLETKGYVRKDKLSRKISSKRTPNQILVKNKLTETMTKEYVLIMEKNKHICISD
jgi:site-specific DNA-methyltransferase (cytosine-N4-specific)